MKVVLISGKARSGKDQSAKILESILTMRGNRVLIIHYADFLKFFCKQHLGFTSKEAPGGRELLQHFGTDIVRKNYQDTWVDMMIALLKGIYTEYDYVIIPDVRFPNEVEKMKNNFQCVILRLIRPVFKTELTQKEQSHISETALDDYEFEHIIFNSGTLDDLGKSLEYFADYLQGENWA